MRGSQPLLPAAYRPVLYEAVGSTNDEAKARARDGTEAGVVVWALQQTSGRGRHGRLWASPLGNLYASLILRPACSVEIAAQLGFVAALAAADMVGQFIPWRAPLACKWPNDVLLSGRKVAGILLESELGPDGAVAFLVIGVGVNLAAAPSDTEFPATSLAAEGVAPPPPKAALDGFLRHFETWSRCWQQRGFGPVRENWRGRAVLLGGQIRARLETVTLYGRFVDIDQQGALLLETGGELRRVSAGDVFPAG
jgi:BirA family transcriptional regulator, biotin operon repressor / biotin---[acetyl-CoA-carboxylase] ligase